MIDKIKRGWYPAGLVRYLMGPGKHEEHVRPRVMASWDGDPDMHQPARTGDGDFAYDTVQLGELIEHMSAPGKAAGLPDRAPAVGEKGSKYGWVWHCSLRNEDSDRVLTDAEWRGVAEDVMERTGIAGADDPGGCRWIAVRHDEGHIHLMATLVRQDTTRRFHPKNDFHVVRAVCREWETKLGLTLTAGVDKTATTAPTRGEIEKAARRIGPHRPRPGEGGGGAATAVLPSRVRLRQIVSQTAATKRGAPQFLDALRAEGLRVHENHGPDGRLRGYAVGVSGDTDRAGKQVLFGGRTLAPDLSLPKLLQRWDSAPLPEVTITPTRLSAVSPEDKVNGLRAGQAAVQHARTALATGAESADGIAHATADLLGSVARVTDGLEAGPGAVAAQVYDRAARTPGAVQPSEWGAAAKGLRMASWQIGIMGMISGKGKDQNAATVALLLALAALTAEIAASRQQAHRLHQAAAASQTSRLLRTHPTVVADPVPDVAQWRRHQQQVQQQPTQGRATAQGTQRAPVLHPNPLRLTDPPRRGPRR
jgi:hypothetical protein